MELRVYNKTLFEIYSTTFTPIPVVNFMKFRKKTFYMFILQLKKKKKKDQQKKTQKKYFLHFSSLDFVSILRTINLVDKEGYE